MDQLKGLHEKWNVALWSKHNVECFIALSRSRTYWRGFPSPVFPDDRALAEIKDIAPSRDFGFSACLCLPAPAPSDIHNRCYRSIKEVMVPETHTHTHTHEEWFDSSKSTGRDIDSLHYHNICVTHFYTFRNSGYISGSYQYHCFSTFFSLRSIIFFPLKVIPYN